MMLKEVELCVEIHDAYVDGSERNSREYTSGTTDITANRGSYHHSVDGLN
jgi:hypothetical protein